MALRFPGADTPDGYWRDIRAGVTHVRRFTDAELAAAGVAPEEYGAPDFVAASAPLPGIDGFDAAFFKMSAREATVTDPQQRLFLECAHHALEDAGYAQPRAGVRIGVCGSTGYRLYSLHSHLANNLAEKASSGDWQRQKQAQVGDCPDFAAPRAAHRLALTGPALNVATACSSSLVSVHLARQALHFGDADLVVVASAALHVPQVTGHRHVRGSTISRSGTVRAFDADADGTVGSNGVAAVVLKPLERALADGDTVYAVIAGSAVTNDGADRAGFAAPGSAGQRDAVLGALRAAGVPADSIGYLEAHGTGTLQGDPIEFAALYTAAATGRPHGLPEPAAQCTDCARWQRAQADPAEEARRTAYWTRYLEGIPATVEIPGDRPRPAVPSGRGDTLRGTASGELRRAVEELAAARHTTPFGVAATALGVLVARRSGVRDIAMGTPYAHRERSAFESMVALTSTGVVVRVTPDPDETRGALVQRTGAGALEATAHVLPTARIVRALRESGARAVPERFPLTIAFQNSLDTDIEIPGLDVEVDDLAPPVSRGDLSFGLAPRRDPAKGYRTFLEYSADPWDPATAQELLDDWQAVLAELCTRPDAPVAPLLNPLQPLRKA
ncbi:condensation domain-containing protein [Streptomyces sp. NBC_01764]|uniref:beta-ketoacyl synthase N-terminal-like domain-containing protein n=1 Tax=Streptomyces sp. NBC_01764 TaxID=2975935 RepID=UPI00225702D8|nr:beta-ketoacyl synthase N-terminal-like domain-containing protein [Streptomyces sp. NBC_01764]MCX4400500.1 condensation domain-containing protein [Streptomyces sp. NBC_01764]